MTGVIFSRNRAMQLDALLRSIYQFAPRLFSEIHVLYRADPEYDSAYRLLIPTHSGIHFIRQTDLKQETLHALSGDLASFLGDDDVFYGPVDPSVTDWLTEEILCFSLRLGKNTTYCYSLDQTQEFDNFETLRNGDVLRWKWREAPCDLGYPFSIDGHVFRVPELKEALAGMSFNNPNELEDQWRHTPTSREYMACYAQSRLVGIPANIVQQTYPNRHEHGSTLELNELFLAGQRIDLERMNFDVRSAHAPIPFVFRKNGENRW